MIILLLYLEKGLITSRCLARCLHHKADAWCLPNHGMPVRFRPSSAVPPAGDGFPFPYARRFPALVATPGRVALGSSAPSRRWCSRSVVTVGRVLIRGNRHCWGDPSWLRCVPRECRSFQSAQPISARELFLSFLSSWAVFRVWRWSCFSLLQCPVVYESLSTFLTCVSPIIPRAFPSSY